MHKFDDMDGETKVVSADQLSFATHEGWKVVSSFEETVHVRCEEQEPNPHPPAPNGFNYSSTAFSVRYKPNTLTFFVVRKTENEVRDALHFEIAESRKRALELESVKEKFEKDLKKTLDELLRVSADHERQASTSRTYREEADRAREISRRLESDLAKVRKAIGDRAFAEILPPPEKKTT